MPPNINPLSLWAILRIKDGFFAVPCDYVQSIVELTDYKSVPNLPKYMRGIMNYQSEIVNIIDMRNRLGIPSIIDEISEFSELMNAREQDHVNWLNTLQDCVHGEKKFTLATDPHKCKFGQWYYQFLSETKDTVLKILLKNFERPHNDIHSIAIQVEQLMHERKQKEAIKLIEEKKNNELCRMIDLFKEAKRIYRDHHQEIAIILKYNRRFFSIIVDEVTAISNLSWDNWRSMDQITSSYEQSTYMLGIAESLEEGSPVVILDVSNLSH